MLTINEYIAQHQDRFLEELFGLLRIPSISSIAFHKPDMYRAAEYLRQALLDAGAEKELLSQAPFDVEKYKAILGIRDVWGEKGYRVPELTGTRPTFDVCGIWGEYTGEGSKTVLPSKACAKISSRIVPNQDHHQIAGLIRLYFESIAPPQITVDVRILHGGPAYVCPLTLPAYKAAELAFEETFGKRPLPFRSGGSIPIISTFEKVLGVKSILMGFGLESDNIHSPNESYPVWNFQKGIETIVRFYHHYTTSV